VTDFLVESAFQPAGDQPTAIAALTHGVNDGLRYQTLEGITGIVELYQGKPEIKVTSTDQIKGIELQTAQ